MNTQIQKIFQNSKKLYQRVTTKSIITIAYYLFLAWLVIGLLFLILAFGLPISPLNQTILIVISLCVLISGLVTFYVFEFIRRKALHYYQVQFDFKTLFNDALLKAQVTTGSMVIDSEFDNAFYKLHFEYAKNTHTDASLSGYYATYLLYTKIGMMYFSHCNVNVLDQKANRHIMQFIITTQTANHERIKQAFDTQQIKYYYKFLNNQHCFCFSMPTKTTIINLQGVKFYRQSWTAIEDLYQANLKLFEDLIRTIQSSQ